MEEGRRVVVNSNLHITNNFMATELLDISHFGYPPNAALIKYDAEIELFAIEILFSIPN